MKKNVIFLILSILALLKIEAVSLPYDSVWNKNFNYNLDIDEFNKNIQVQISTNKWFSNEFNDTIFKYYKIDTPILNELKNIAIIDSKDIEDLKNMSENLRIDTHQLQKLKNLKSETIFKDEQGSKRIKTEKITIRQSKPTRVENKTFSNINKVNFDHQHGNITIEESNSAQVVLTITYLDISGKKAVSSVSTEKNSLSIKTLNSGSNSGKINYKISIPKNTALNINLSHGNILIGNHSGVFNSALKYSSLNANSLVGSDLLIRGNYNDIFINKVSDINIRGSYTKIKIGNVNDLGLYGSYNNYAITNAKKIEMSGNYNKVNITNVKDLISKDSSISGDFKIESIDNLNINMKYANVMINYITNSFISNCDYSNIQIKSSSSKLNNININGRYSDIIWGFSNDFSASFDIDLKYGNLNVDRKYKIKYTEQNNSTKQLSTKGIIGSKKPTTRISISNRYANVTFK